MDSVGTYFSDSVRKINRLFSSLPQASTLGKRKARDDEDMDHTPSKRHTSLHYSEEQSVMAEHSCGGSSTRRQSKSHPLDPNDPYAHVIAIDDDDDFDYRIPQPPQQRIRKPTNPSKAVRSRPATLNNPANAATQKAKKVMRKAQEATEKRAATREVQSQEREIQDELDRQQRQEEADRKALLTHKIKSQAGPSKAQSSLLTVPHDSGQTSRTSYPGTVPRSSALKTRTAMSAEASWNSLTSQEKWSTKPNRRAREVLEESGHDASALLKDLREPEYACRDIEIRDWMWKMMSQIEDFADAYFNFTVDDDTLLRTAFRSMAKETVKIIGCVASGGPAGASGWEDLFLVADKRKALVCAIIGNVLAEQVFQHIFFGGTEAQIEEVAAIQEQHKDKDGFDRNTLYAAKIRSFLTSTSKKDKAPTHQLTNSLQLPINFTNHTNHITTSLISHLKPLFSLNPKPTDYPIHALYTLTTSTALLSLQMRLDPHTVYHFTPVFKEQPFSRTTMECINEATMIATHPKGKGDEDLISTDEQARRATLNAGELARMRNDEGLVQIALLPGITAYRLGGWETSSSRVDKPRFEVGCADQGVRARRLTDAWVFCRWGRARCFENGRPADDPAVHGVRWGEGGFIEFFPGVDGVQDPRSE